MTATRGNRVLDRNLDPSFYCAGDYGLYGGIWYARLPSGVVVSLQKHSITCHADGTISVDGRIAAAEYVLEHGVWRT